MSGLDGAGVPPGPPGPMSPELTEAVTQVGEFLAAKEWRSRSDALAALAALLPALPEVPNAPLAGLLQQLAARIADPNPRVASHALQVGQRWQASVCVDGWGGAREEGGLVGPVWFSGLGGGAVGYCCCVCHRGTGCVWGVGTGGGWRTA